MADDKKTIGPDVGIPTEAPEQPAPEPALADAEAVMLEHEGQAALFEMGEAVPDPADAVTRAEVEAVSYTHLGIAHTPAEWQSWGCKGE